MIRNIINTDKGRIAYRTFRQGGRINDKMDDFWLVFLPGLSADHRLFEKQMEYFSKYRNCLVWDPPAHGESECVLIGQSFGGYVAQAFMSLFKGIAVGFVSIDSAPLDRRYYSKAELWLLRHTYRFYMCFPWRLLVKAGSYSCAETEYGRRLMRTMMLSYGKKEYCRLAARGYMILSECLSSGSGRPDCPVLLICGKKDRQITNIYNRKWAAGARMQVHWIDGAGHNANTDRPETVNRLIETFVNTFTDNSNEISGTVL